MPRYCNLSAGQNKFIYFSWRDAAYLIQRYCKLSYSYKKTFLPSRQKGLKGVCIYETIRVLFHSLLCIKEIYASMSLLSNELSKSLGSLFANGSCYSSSS